MSNPVVRYRLLKAATIETLEAAITASLSDGFQPTGDLILDHKYQKYYQSMFDDGSGLGHDLALLADLNNVTLLKEDFTSRGVDAVAHIVTGTLLGAVLANTNAVVAHNQALVVPVTGTYVTTATVHVVGGVVTSIVLS